VTRVAVKYRAVEPVNGVKKARCIYLLILLKVEISMAQIGGRSIRLFSLNSPTICGKLHFDHTVCSSLRMRDTHAKQKVK
jgi:hypothetical protein